MRQWDRGAGSERKMDGPCGPEGCDEKVLKIDARVLKFDSGLWPLRVVVSTPLASMSIKTALRANLPALQSF